MKEMQIGLLDFLKTFPTELQVKISMPIQNRLCYDSLLEKIKKVLESCKTKDQFLIADKYGSLVLNKIYKLYSYDLYLDFYEYYCQIYKNVADKLWDGIGNIYEEDYTDTTF